MGLGGISIPSLLIILVIVLLLFGTKKLRNLGGDLGGAIKGFKKAVTDDEKNAEKLEDKHDPIDEANSSAEEQKAESDKTESK